MILTIEEVISRIDDWKDKEVRCKPLGGGITNHNYTVHVESKPFVVRIPGAGTDLFIDRNNELDCSIEAWNTGVAPKVIHHLKPENVSVFQFINRKTLTTPVIAGNDDLIKRIVNAIKRIHETTEERVKFLNWCML